jgi:GNAT superfamily N-acetyltransferase
MSTVPDEMTNARPLATRATPRVQVVAALDPYVTIEAAGLLGEQRAWLEGLLGRSMDEVHPSSREEYAHPESYYRPPDAALFVGRIDGFPAGVVAAYRVDDATVELRRLYVRPVGRGTGLGRRLSQAVIDHARSRSAKRVRLDTSATLMPAAVRLYRALGFREMAAQDYTDVPGIVGMELAL